MRVIAFAALCLLVSGAGASAQQPMLSQPQQSSGVYTTYVGGQTVSAESYTFAAGADGTLRAEAEVGPAAGGPKRKTVTTAKGARPLSFTVEADGARVYAAEFGAGRGAKIFPPAPFV
jgi:hypothetical protein